MQRTSTQPRENQSSSKWQGKNTLKEQSTFDERAVISHHVASLLTKGFDSYYLRTAKNHSEKKEIFKRTVNVWWDSNYFPPCGNHFLMKGFDSYNVTTVITIL